MTSTSLKNYSFRGRALTQFLGVMPEVKESLAGGFTLRIIWHDLRERGLFDAQYAQFALYVRHYIDPKTKPIAPFKSKPVGNSPTQHESPKTQLEPPKSSSQPQSWKEEPQHLRTEEKPKKQFNFTTIGKEYLMEPYEGDDKKQERKPL